MSYNFTPEEQKRIDVSLSKAPRCIKCKIKGTYHFSKLCSKCNKYSTGLFMELDEQYYIDFPDGYKKE